MMDYTILSGASGGGMMFLASISYILINVLLLLGIAALWKYVNKK